MKEALVDQFQQHPQLAIAISLLLSTVVALLGVVPSIFITAANLLFFGFWKGTAISFLGEAIGAGVSFFLYRKGFKRASQQGLERFPKVKRLVDAEGNEAFMLILSLRLIPFVPSGLVTFAAAIGNTSTPVFLVASSVGKVPALLLEAYAVYEVGRFDWPGKVLLALTALFIIYFVIKKRNPTE